jgi:hypothetical protein
MDKGFSRCPDQEWRRIQRVEAAGLGLQRALRLHVPPRDTKEDEMS